MFQQLTTRLAALALGILMLLAIAACQSNNTEPTATPVGAVTTSTAVAPADQAPAAVETGAPAGIPTGGPAPVQTGAPALTP